jgi:hypothetical protein
MLSSNMGGFRLLQECFSSNYPQFMRAFRRIDVATKIGWLLAAFEDGVSRLSFHPLGLAE